VVVVVPAEHTLRLCCVVLQTFVQDPNNPAILYNHGNEYLHYEDDWYILAYKPNTYVVRKQGCLAFTLAFPATCEMRHCAWPCCCCGGLPTACFEPDWCSLLLQVTHHS